MENFEVRIAAPVQKDSIVDGEGLRTVIWFQGCPHHCEGCHNPESWAYDKGITTTINDLKEEIYSLRNQEGITISGGEPFVQREALLEIVKVAKECKLNIWVYTGFLFENILEYASVDKIYYEILKNIDVLVDGPFLKDQKSLNLYFKGSKNQRILDIKKSLKTKTAYVIPKYKKEKKVSKISA